MPANRIQLQKVLHKPYDRVLFSREVLSPVFGSGFTLNSSLMPAPLSPNKSESAAIANVWIYGKIQLDDSTEITCYEITLKPNVRLEYSKVAIQQYVRKLLTAGQAALINFIAPANNNVWRLTLVAKDSVLTDKGVKEKTTNAKRYTFLLGPSETCKTAAERLETLSTEKGITFQTLVNAFSVEKLSKAFFDEYTLHYRNFCDYLQESNYRKSVFNISFPADASKQEKDKASKPIRDFVKKLLGRIVFLYFVQKKRWLGASDTHYSDGLGNFIKQLFLQSGGNDAFYSNWLTVLFFDTLNKQRSNDDFTMPDGKIVKVPFLNGGLFDKEEFDEHLLTFPAKLFHNPDYEDTILTPKNNGYARGFLDFLDAFNFTIYEDSPDDQTVAIDPEMLGHIFENLLEDNKDKGAFYTPKEIVHYMCQESLTEYLCTTLQIKDEVAEREAVNHLLKNKVVHEILIPELTELEKALDNVKICDPAIGSGAFPMGLLQEIFSIKELIAYETGKEWKPSEVKENIIQNSIYGVDIEKGAVDIARLRFWLSLVVDEEKPKALPNLDYKIVVGDSLISKFEGEIVEIDWKRKSSEGELDEYVKNVQRLLKEVAEKQKQYFSPNNNNKKELQAEIRNMKIELLINQLSFNKEIYKRKTARSDKIMSDAADIKHNIERELQIAGFDKIINKLKDLQKHHEKPFNHFDWKLDFPEVLNPYLVPDVNQRGFDIVIGNPPYIQLQKEGGRLAKQFENQRYQTFERTGDIYTLFYEKGIQLLKQGGHLTYITSNKWMRAGYGESTRAFFAQYNPIRLIDLGSGIFETATVDTNILMIEKAQNQNHCKAADVSKIKQIDFANLAWVTLTNLGKDSWTIASDVEQRIKAKIEAKGKPLKEWDIQINYGIKTGYNEAFIIDGKKKDELIAQDPRSAEIIKPILRGRDIKRYKAEFADLWLINSHNGVKETGIPRIDVEKDYPAIYQHLKQYEPQLVKRQDKGDHWSNLRNCAYIQEFEKEKIVYSEIVREPQFYLDCGHYYPEATAFIITGKYLKFLIGNLHSKLLTFVFKKFYSGGGLGEDGYRYKKQFLEQLPVALLSESERQPFVELVNQILALKEQGKDTSALEQQIDNLVYRLYDLTYDEVKVIDPDFPLSRQECEAIRLE